MARKQTAAPDEVSLTLAHPISRKNDLRYLGLSGQAEVGDTVKVNHNAARTLITSGYAAGVDPQDPEAVAEALGAAPAATEPPAAPTDG